MSNVFLVYFFVYTVRIKKWSFGLGTLFGGLESLAKKVKGLFGKKEKAQKSEE